MPTPPPSPDCTCSFPGSLNRRQFLKAASVGLAAAAARPGWEPRAWAAPSPRDASETLVAQLYRSLEGQQRQKLCFPFDHPLRDKIDNNWMITGSSVRDTLNPDQQDLVRQIFRGLHRPEYAEAVMNQVVHDSEGKGFEGGTSIALFGDPGTGQFEFVITGRHLTRRCDGDSVAGTAFGGPIFYGHQAGDRDREAPDHPGNVYWFQAKRANAVFQALDGRQQSVALIDGRGRAERATETVRLPDNQAAIPGLRVGDLTRDQQGLVRGVMADLLAPFRKPDADEAMKVIEAQGLETLSLAYFKQEDMGNDRVWDVWQIEGPSMIWYFRGAPHVHCWVNVREGTA